MKGNEEKLSYPVQVHRVSNTDSGVGNLPDIRAYTVAWNFGDALPKTVAPRTRSRKEQRKEGQKGQTFATWVAGEPSKGVLSRRVPAYFHLDIWTSLANMAQDLSYAPPQGSAKHRVYTTA